MKHIPAGARPAKLQKVVRPAGTKLARAAAQGTLTKRHPSAVDDYFSQRYAQRLADKRRTTS